MAYPVRDISLPAVLQGQPNGKLPDSILWDTPAPGVSWACRLVPPAARAWRALSVAALEAGHVLKPSGPHDSYRPYDTQLRIFLQRFTTTPNGSRTRRTWRGQTWYLKPGYALAAVPGTSNHGRAIAVDVGEERDGDTGTESLDAGTLAWLVENEERLGWSHEVQSEPWHLRYFAGDRIPRAVLDHESNSEEFIMDAEVKERFDKINEALLILIGEGRELDDDVPENLVDIAKELRVNERTILQELNRLRQADGLPPLPIVIGYNGSTPIYQTED